MLNLLNVSKQYAARSNKTQTLAVLNNYSCQFSAHRECIVGENGSGKSTLLLAVSGLLAIDNGVIEFNGQETTQNTRKQRFSIASDSIVIPEFLSANQVLQLTSRTWQVAWPAKLIEQFNFTAHIDKTVDALSAGNLKKLQIICALMRKSELLLLDEPNIALDEKSVSNFWWGK